MAATERHAWSHPATRAATTRPMLGPVLQRWNARRDWSGSAPTDPAEVGVSGAMAFPTRAGGENGNENGVVVHEAHRYDLVCDHGGDHMKVVTVRDFRDRASEMFRSHDVILVTRDGAPAGFYLPWDTPELPVEVRREVFLRLSEEIGVQLEADGASEQEILDDLAAGRRRR